jgi:ubiquinone/menaquinone biosynthesis C-methylase UbiE
MSQESDPSKTTYFIDAENSGEMARLINQDRILTRCMGGLFPTQLDLSSIHDILDIGCGPGGWAMDVAKAYPDRRVTGIDISQLMIEFARYKAASEDLHNVNFMVMDATKPLDFPDDTFDSVNARLISGFVPKTAWSPLMQECMRIIRPGGILRLTESEANISNSFAVDRLNERIAKAMYLAGQTFSPSGWQYGTTPMLQRFLRSASFQRIKSSAHVLDCSYEAEEHKSQYQNAMVFFKLIQPFLVKLGVITQEEVEALYQRALEEMMLPDYCCVWYFLSVWGEKPHEEP